MFILLPLNCFTSSLRDVLDQPLHMLVAVVPL